MKCLTQNLMDLKIGEMMQSVDSFNLKRYTKFHRLFLNDKEAVVYDTIRTALINSAMSIPIEYSDYVDYDYYYRIIKGVLNDNPIIFWTREQLTFRDDGKRLHLQFYYNSLEQHKESLLRKIEEKAIWIRDNIIIGCRDEYMISEQLHDFLISDVTYDKDDEEFHHTLVGPLIFNRGACDSISDSYSYLMNVFGVRCTVVHGDVPEGYHAWNISIINKRVYHTDVTFDLNGGHRFLNNNDLMMSYNRRYHRYLVADKMSDNWYCRHGCYFKTASDAQKYIADSIAGGKKELEFFSDEPMSFESVENSIPSSYRGNGWLMSSSFDYRSFVLNKQ